MRERSAHLADNTSRPRRRLSGALLSLEALMQKQDVARLFTTPVDAPAYACLLYTPDASDDMQCDSLGRPRPHK